MMSKMFRAKASVSRNIIGAEMAAPSGDCTGSRQISVCIIESICTSLHKLEKEIDRIGDYVGQIKGYVNYAIPTKSQRITRYATAQLIMRMPPLPPR